MKNFLLAGVLSAFSVMGAVGIMAPSKATGDSLPVGTIIAWGGPAASVPANWMLCNGKALSRTVYMELFAAIGASWGSAGDKFNLPDLRGRFLRGEDAGTGRDPDVRKRAPSCPGGSSMGVGSVQADSLQNHTHDQSPHSHYYSYFIAFPDIADTGSGLLVPGGSSSNFSTSADSATLRGAAQYGTKSRVTAGEESRPKNAAVNFIIKVK